MGNDSLWQISLRIATVAQCCLAPWLATHEAQNVPVGGGKREYLMFMFAGVYVSDILNISPSNLITSHSRATGASL